MPVKALDRVRRAGGALIRSVAPSSGRRRLREPPLVKGRVLVERLSELAAALLGANDELDLLALRARGAAWHAQACLDADELDRVVWAEPNGLGWAPVDVSRRLREALWDGGPTAILVSATLTTEGDFGFVRDRLGLRGARELAVGSPFDFEKQALLHLPRGLPDPRTPRAVERVAEEAAELCELSSGRALVLTSSYRTLEAVADRLRGRIGHELLVQGEAPRERLLEQFREDISSVLVATGTFWQGVDIPGEALSLLVIDKLPVPAAGRSARRGAVRADHGRGRGLVRVLCPAVGRASAAAGVRATDPEQERPRRHLPARSEGADTPVRPCVPRFAATVPRRRGPGSGARVPRRRCPAGQLAFAVGMADKPRTPDPPRKVQAPKVRQKQPTKGGGLSMPSTNVLIGAGLVALVSRRDRRSSSRCPARAAGAQATCRRAT